MHKVNVLVLFGGMSAEYDVSCASAANVLRSIDGEKYNVTAAGITRDGGWFKYGGPLEKIADRSWNGDTSLLTPCALIPGRERGRLVIFSGDGTHKFADVDVILPIIHGRCGEDGSIQGMARLCGIPCAGADVSSSALCFDKAAAKDVCAAAGIPQGKYLAVTRAAWENNRDAVTKKCEAALGWPVFVKPSNGGSSIGTSRAEDAQGLIKAAAEAFKYDEKILIEEFIDGRELEISVMGNGDPITSDMCGEIVPEAGGFYDYEAKYLNDSAKLVVPAPLSPDEFARIRSIALKAYSVLGCAGFARVDFFMKKDGAVLLNEVNTIPGFTDISFFPLLLSKSGYSYAQIIDRIIQLALDKNK